jgi:hypothetical protein
LGRDRLGCMLRKHLGHPRVTVAHQSNWALLALGLNSSQFCSRS